MTTRRQHVVSRVLLKRFSEKSGTEFRIQSFDLQYRQSKIVPIGRVGWVRDFVAHEPKSAEALWATTENALPGALLAVDDDTIFSAPDHVETLKRALALHYFRNPQTRHIFERSFKLNLAKRLRAASGRIRRSGVPAKGEERAREATALISRAAESQKEAWFQDQLEDMYRRSWLDLPRRGLEIVDSLNADFVITDAGTVGVSERRTASRVGFFDLSAQILPIGRTCAISLGPINGRTAIKQDQTFLINQLQIGAAARHIFSHPDVDLVALVQDALAPQ